MNLLNELQDKKYITQSIDNETLMSFRKMRESVQCITKLDDYLYDITVPVDYTIGFDEFENVYKRIAPACTSVRFGSCHGRNFDWIYDKGVTFLVRTPHTDELYATIGVGCDISGFSSRSGVLTKEYVESGQWNDRYLLLPFATLDGINEKGLCVSCNVVPVHDLEKPTTGTNPGAPNSICTFMLLRWLIDHYATATEAVTAIQNDLNIWAPANKFGYEIHYLISDPIESYIVEFWNNSVIVSKVYGEGINDPKAYITNFYVNGVQYDEGGKVIIDSTTPNGSGIERYNYITANKADFGTASSMMESLGSKLKYTNAYRRTTSPSWNSEFVGVQYGGHIFTNRDSQETFQPWLDHVYEVFETSFSRESGAWWQTVHTTIYDMDTKELHILTQEQDLSKVKTISFADMTNIKHLIPND